MGTADVAAAQRGGASLMWQEWAGKPQTWIATGIGGLALTEAVLLLFGEDSYPASEAAWWSIFALSGWGINHYRPKFEEAFAGLVELTERGRDDAVCAESFVAKRTRGLFTLRSPIAYGPIAVVLALWWWTVYELGTPFENGFVSFLSYLFFIPMVVAGVWGCVLDIGAVASIREAASKDLRTPFSIARHPVMNLIETGWAAAGLVIVLVWVALLVAFWLGPHSLANVLVWWLALFALFPVFWLIVGTLQIHSMLATIKGQHLERASARVAELSAALTPEAPDATLQDLDAAMEIEAKVQAMKEWPSGLAWFPTFAVSLAPLALQFALIAFNVGEPV